MIFLEWLRSRDFQCSISEPNCADFISQFLKYLKYLIISFSFHFLKWNQPQIHWIMELINGRIPLLHLCVRGGGGQVCVCGGYMHIDSAHYPCLYLPNGVSEHLLAVMSYFAHVYTLFFSDKAGGGGGGIVLGWCMTREREGQNIWRRFWKASIPMRTFLCINTWWMLDMDLDVLHMKYKIIQKNLNQTERSLPNISLCISVVHPVSSCWGENWWEHLVWSFYVFWIYLSYIW